MKTVKTLSVFLLLAAATCSAARAERLAIDLFEYEDAAAARKVWKPQETTQPVGLIEHQTDLGATAMCLPCDFSNQQARSYWDCSVDLNLSGFSRFTFLLYIEKPEAVQWATVYFESPGGWYSGVYAIRVAGWQRISISKSDFTTEQRPSGWNKITRIRLAFWKSGDTDTRAAIDDFEAVRDEIVVVLGDNTLRKHSPESEAVRQYHSNMMRLLTEAGIEAGGITDTEVAAGALAGRQLAIFPYSPDISGPEAAAVKTFVQNGGKIFVCYTMPPQIASLLGLTNPQWTRERRPGEFARIIFNQQIAPGLPASTVQGSHNIWMYDLGDQVTALGNWADSEGADTGIPAVVTHPNGAFMGHVMQSADADVKKQMLLAILGQLLPEKRREFATASIDRAGALSGFSNFEAVADFVESHAEKLPTERRTAAVVKLNEAKMALDAARQLDPENDYGKAIRLAFEAGPMVRDAFMHCFTAPEGEFRGLWCHSPRGVRGWSWEKAAQTARKAGFTALIPNMMWAGCTAYESDYQPTTAEARNRDLLAECLKACRGNDLQLHVWKVNYNLGWASGQFVQQMHAAGRLQKDRNGREVRWLCPSDPANFELEKNVMLEVVRNYDVDGIHFDYIRYPDANSCYCDGCRRRFEEASGVKIANWPTNAINGPQQEAFAQWRREQITRLVRAVSNEARAIRPDIKISAAVFWRYPECRENEGQDWKLWIEEGLVDFVCPMSYTDTLPYFRIRAAQHSSIAAGRVPVYEGIGASVPGLRPEEVALQIQAARDLGAEGFVIFQYDLSTALTLLPELSKGITRE